MITPRRWVCASTLALAACAPAAQVNTDPAPLSPAAAPAMNPQPVAAAGTAQDSMARQVTALADQVLQTALTRTSGGQLLAVLQSTYGIPTQVSAQRDLHLPAAGTVTLRSAELPEGVPVLPGARTTGPAGTGESSGTLSGDDVSEGD